MKHFIPPKGLHIRPSRAADKAFLEKLHHAVRNDLQFIDGDKDQIEAIIEMQFCAQNEGYGDQFPNAMYFIIEKHHQPIGKATVDFGPNEIRLIDIAFLPEARGHGFGRAIVQSFQVCSANAGAPLTLSVAQTNLAAKRLYLSLGFQIEQSQPPYDFLAWYPALTKIRA